MKRDKVLTRAIIISVAIHLVAVCFIGRTSNTRLNASVITPAQQHLMNVDLVKDPYADPPKPKPPVVSPPKPDTPEAQPKQGFFSSLAAKVFGPRPAPTPTRVANNPGGAVNTGTSDRNGDIGVRNGNTSVGTVPGSDNGRGNGHGDAPGVNHTDPTPAPPVRPVYVQPTPQPPPPPPPPAPKKVTRSICEASGMLAGPNCKNTRDASFSEGDEPRHTCDKCRAPEPVHVNRIADRKDPELVRKSDIRPHIPDSVEEGQVVQTEVEYYSDADGGVSGVQVIKSSGNREFDRSVIGAVLQWRYSPAVQDGVPQRVKMTRKVTGKG